MLTTCKRGQSGISVFLRAKMSVSTSQNLAIQGLHSTWSGTYAHEVAQLWPFISHNMSITGDFYGILQAMEVFYVVFFVRLVSWWLQEVGSAWIRDFTTSTGWIIPGAVAMATLWAKISCPGPGTTLWSVRSVLLQASLDWKKLSPLKNEDRDHIGSRTGNSIEMKFSLLMHVDACKAQEMVEQKIMFFCF